jgi:general secretion pathway protein C
MNTLINRLPKSLDWQKINQTMPVVFNVLLILAISYILAQLSWLLMPDEPESQGQPAGSSIRHTANKQSAQQIKIQQIPQAHLFGNYKAVINKAVKTVAPDTRLNLELKGVLAANPMDKASAIISMGKRGKEDIYGIGDKVSSATVREIYPDRIILERSGRFETLRLPKEFSSNTLIKSSGASPNTSAQPSSPGQVLGNIRKKIIQNPTSFGQYAIPIPYNENGKLRGYRLQPQKDRALFDQVGLNPSDVVIGINGVKLDNPANGLKALRALQSAKQVNITVLRNGAEIPLSFEIP